MINHLHGDPTTGQTMAADPASMERHFGGADDLLSLWIAEPYLEIAPSIVSAIEERASTGWYGYETRPSSVVDSFWSWMSIRHGWDGQSATTSISPSVGTSIGALISLLTDPGDGVILQPPVFTDFKPLIASAGRQSIRSALTLVDGRYQMDLDGLDVAASDPTTRLMILCNPHNPVGRVWTRQELADVAAICARKDVFVVADEIHADLALPPSEFIPFGPVAEEHGAQWAATHGPIKTFGLAGLCDTVLVTGDDDLAGRFRELSSQLHLTRNNVFGLAAFEAAYRTGAEWLDALLDLTTANRSLLSEGLPDGIDLFPGEGTYLGWLDLRALGMDVPRLAGWLHSSARLALSPGHWFGREGAGFVRMTLAAPSEQISEAVDRFTAAVAATLP